MLEDYVPSFGPVFVTPARGTKQGIYEKKHSRKDVDRYLRAFLEELRDMHVIKALVRTIMWTRGIRRGFIGNRTQESNESHDATESDSFC